MAGTFMLGIALSLFFGWSMLVWVFEALLLAALAALTFGRFCLGSYLFLLFTWKARFANQTLQGLEPSKPSRFAAAHMML
jgi:hypothetical protein